MKTVGPFDVQLTNAVARKGKRPLNEFAFRHDATTEVDFFAKNGTAQVVGMFQLIPPDKKKLGKFVADQDILRKAFHFQKSFAILGVGLGNSTDLRNLASRFHFHAAFVRSGKGFVKL